MQVAVEVVVLTKVLVRVCVLFTQADQAGLLRGPSEVEMTVYGPHEGVQVVVKVGKNGKNGKKGGKNGDAPVGVTGLLKSEAPEGTP